MRRSYRPTLLAFITFLVNGLTYGQDNELYCETFCLANQTTCTCTFSEGFLKWEVRNAGGDRVGQRNVEGDDVDKDTVLFGENTTAASAFSVTVISMSGTFISVLSFNTLSEYQGYVIECTVDEIPSIRTINIAEPPTVANLNMINFTADSAILTFEGSVSSDCIASYTVTTNASVPSSSINDTSVTISKPNGEEGDTYSVCVSAVDNAGQMGSSSCVDCFRFSRPNAVTFYSDVNDGCAANVGWTPDSCLPLATSYNVTINSGQEVEIRDVHTTTLQINSITYGEEYTVTVTPNNTFGFGVPASINFTVRADCPVMMGETSSSPTSGSASLLFPGPGVLSVGVIAGFIISVGFSAVMF